MAGHPTGRQAGQEYERILEAMGDGVYTLDPDGTFTHFNDAFRSLTGYGADTVYSRGPELLFAASDIERFEGAIAAMLDGGDVEPRSVTAPLRPKGAEPFPVEVTLSLLTSQDGRFEGTVGVVRNLRERRERERDLERAKRRFEAVFEDPQLLVALLSPAGELLDINRTAMEFVQEEREALLGSYFPDTPWWTADVHEDVVAWIERAADGEYVEFECDLERPAVGHYAVDGVVRPVTDDEGTVVSLIVSAQDVTERRQRQRQLERYEVLLDLMPDTVVITDIDGELQEIHGDGGWSGYDVDDLVDGQFEKTVTEESVERARDATRSLLSGDGPEKATYEHVSLTADGEEIPFENHMTLLPADEDGTVSGTMSVLRNIADQKARERKLRQQNEQLEEFARVVSHDLRNPLNVAAGHVELLQAELDNESLDSVERAHERIRAVIDDVLALAREGEAVEATEPVGLETVARLAWDAVDTAGSSLRVVRDRRVLADRSRLQRLLENLIRNAIDHNEADVSVTVAGVDDGAGTGDFYVADDGVGLPPDDGEAIFESGHSTTADGTGFGLAIVRRIAEAHGWSVAATESASGGARFEITGVATP